MAVKIINLTNDVIRLSEPVARYIKPKGTATYPYVEYDLVINTPSLKDLIDRFKIRVIDLDAGSAAVFVSQWDLEPKLRLTPYTFWIDTLGYLRMKVGDPTSDLDGIVIGPGGGTPAPHGSTHVFDGTDPVPRIEVLEGLWNCPTTVALRDAVYQTGTNSVDKADATSSTTMPVIGLVLAKTTTTECIIARSGELSGFSGLTADRIYYASAATPGGVTLTPPTGTAKIVQKIGYSKTSSIITVELGETRKRA